ncbi:hypothetical protein Q8G35_17405 [Peribacillus simplex]|uniref:Uncharacterized protein n=2 Tax=Peribacillus TaxID=2675229 RepID=A0AA90PJZ6_9BACI|nr:MULTISPECIES: hypothetical protein [Peribacillus]MDP1420120.1 hypothetical protein [Peribacillus simplex]MDP1453790.1 hypothetical protein [Peribacillus frigoritolerans]
MTRVKEGQARKGRPSNYSDEQLKEMALEIKKKYKGQKLTYLFLEKETGIGRNTWSRRIPETIDELNKPVSRSVGISESDDVYFPNIEKIFEAYKNDKNKIISELYFIETAFYELYNTVKNLKEELNRRRDDSAELKMKNDEIRLLQEQVKHYEQLYNQQMISSAFSHLQSQNQVKDNLIQFDKNNRKHASLENLETFFELEGSNTLEENASLSKIENRFSNIFKKDR